MFVLEISVLISLFNSIYSPNLNVLFKYSSLFFFILEDVRLCLAGQIGKASLYRAVKKQTDC